MADANFIFVGTISMVKDGDKVKGFDSKTFDSGWNMRTANFNVVCGDNRHFTSVKGGVMTKSGKVDPAAKLYTFGRSSKDEEGNTIKGEKMEIPFKDRQNYIDKIAGFKLYTLDTEEYGKRNNLEKIVEGYKTGEVDASLLDEYGIKDEADAKAKLEESNAKKKVFASPWDFAKAVADHFKDGKDKNLYVVKGNLEIQYNAEKDIEYKSYVAQRIYKASPETEPSSIVNMDFFFNKDALDKSDWEESKVATVSGYQRYYHNDKQRGISGEFACETGFKINSSYPKAEALMKKMSKGFSEDKPFKKMTVKLIAVDGAQREEIKYEDLTDDQKEDIELGLATLEDYQKALGTAYGDTVREYVLNDVIISEGAMVQDTEFTEMSKPHAEVSLEDADGLDDLL